MTAPALAPAVDISHDTGVSPTPGRRRFTAAYKMKILEEIDRCNHHGDIGALLRREGLYSSQLSAWRRAREQGEIAKRRGPKTKPEDASAKQAIKRVVELERELARAVKRAERAEALVEVQKKVAALLAQIDQLDHLKPESSALSRSVSGDLRTGPR